MRAGEGAEEGELRTRPLGQEGRSPSLRHRSDAFPENILSIMLHDQFQVKIWLRFYCVLFSGYFVEDQSCKLTEKEKFF